MIIITFGGGGGVCEGYLSLFLSKNDFYAILDHKNFSCIVQKQNSEGSKSIIVDI